MPEEATRVAAALAAHEARDNERFAEIKDDTGGIRRNIEKIKDNHLAHIEKSLGSVAISIATHATEIKNIKEAQGRAQSMAWAIILLVLAGVITSVMNLLHS